ncbi:MAG TPA: hypothetical protein VNG34_12320, partial [Actinomycetota bacterium]|nr:hypothetical protein [Actinomycetota bacterium]
PVADRRPDATRDEPSPALSGTPDVIAAGLRAHREAGADHLIASLDPCTEENLAEFAEAVTLFRAG